MQVSDKLPGYASGTWTLDPAHTDIGFSVRHLMVSKVRGSFTEFSGTITTEDSDVVGRAHRGARRSTPARGAPAPPLERLRRWQPATMTYDDVADKTATISSPRDF
jgi:hypothetical protein